MPENNAITKEDLQNAIVELTKLIKETASATEHSIMSEMNRRFDVSDKRFRRADRQRQEFRKAVENRFHEIEGKLMNRFSQAEEHTDEAVERLGRDVTTKLDRQAKVIDDFRVEQTTMGSEQSKIRKDLDAAKKSNDAKISTLTRRVTKLEEEVFTSPAEEA